MEKRTGPKPAYTTAQNVGYMVTLAWREQKSVLWLCLALALLHVAISLTELYLAPLVLGKVEAAAPLAELLLTIAAMAGALALLRGLRAYTDQNALFGRVGLRVDLTQKITLKSLTTSYPNVGNPELEKEKEQAMQALYTNDSAGEAVWRVLTEIAQNLLGFGVYLLLFLSLDPVLVLIAAGSAVLSYLCARPGARWSYAHRKEEGALGQRMSYIRKKAADRGALKDILLFGMGDWLKDVYTSVLDLYRHFARREQRVYLWGDLAEVFFTLARNGAAYGYLLVLTLREGLPAAQFLLYVTAVGNFTTWVTGILQAFGELHRFSLELCSVRQYLEAPEQFRFETGKPLSPSLGQPYGLRLEDVSFRYPGAEEDTLSHIDLTVAPGEKLAIVGLNGAGKTTLMKLCCGLLDPTGGRVLLNGEDIRDFNRRDYYRLFSTVFQDFSVFDTTFADNVTQIPRKRRHRRHGGRRQAGGPVGAIPLPTPGRGHPHRHRRLRGRHPALRRRAPAADAGPGPVQKRAHHHPGRAHRRPGPHRRAPAVHLPPACLHPVLRPHPAAGPGTDRRGGHPPVPIGAGREVRRAL